MAKRAIYKIHSKKDIADRIIVQIVVIISDKWGSPRNLEQFKKCILWAKENNLFNQAIGWIDYDRRFSVEFEEHEKKDIVKKALLMLANVNKIRTE